ncbi:MAG TPA: coniferyl aldehyde dehydrogenase [Hyphomonas sp.]|nr:coniferyl aldehyde dehydrogenase [Hyphomonas sp.]
MALDGTTDSGMRSLLDRQKAAHLRDGIPSAAKRIEWLDKSIDLLFTHGDALNEAMCADFGHRSKDQSNLTDIAGSIGALKFAKANLAKWMRPEKRKVEFPLGLLGSKAELQFQPKGVIGVISPWNFPVNLTFTPLAGVFAAGNRCMIKPSEFTEATSELMKSLIAKYYSPEECVVVTGGPEVGGEFTRLPFDHILFTGATSIAHHVMRAAADNLVPLTLELGGKSPVILGRSADMQKAANRIMAGKTLNAGQICLAPDYAFVPKEKTQDFIGAATRAVETMYASGLKDNDDYTSVINQRHYDRIMGYVEDAKAKGAQVLEINPKSENFAQQPHHKIPPTLIIDPTDDMKVMQDEIFGPILPVKSYGDAKDAVAYINAHPRPLGLYYFGEDQAERELVLNNTTSGGVTVNDVIFHVAQEDLPFGGVGPSGMGHYHGREGFETFSKLRPVFHQAPVSALKFFGPPYGARMDALLKFLMK